MIYLKALSETLPISGPLSKLNKLQNFVLDDDWVKEELREPLIARSRQLLVVSCLGIMMV